jgi:hypothetical protein
MILGRTIRAVLSAFASEDEVTINQIRAAIYQEYSGAELMRCGCRTRGKKSRRAVAYIAGESLSEDDRSVLAQIGVNTILRQQVKHKHKRLFAFDETKGVVRLVRT